MHTIDRDIGKYSYGPQYKYQESRSFIGFIVSCLIFILRFWPKLSNYLATAQISTKTANFTKISNCRADTKIEFPL